MQGGSFNSLTSDAFLVLPMAALGREYYVMSYQYTLKHTKLNQGKSQFGVVGTRNGTRLSILLPPTNPDIELAEGVTRNGRMLTVTLDAYETLQVRAICYVLAMSYATTLHHTLTNNFLRDNRYFATSVSVRTRRRLVPPGLLID